MEEEAIPERGAADGDRASSSSSSPTSAASENPLEEAAVAEGAAESSPMDTPRNGPGDCARAPMSPLASIRQQAKHVRSGSFQKWRRQMQRAWRWGPGGRGGAAGGGGGREQGMRATLNLEVMANQKRQWYRIHSRARDHKQHEEPTSLYEHFFIVGLHSYANVEVIEDAFAKRKAWESDVAKSEILDLRKIQYHGRMPSLEPQILFKYPPGKRMEMREGDLPAFCFPEGVKARLIEKTPSMSDLNEVVFGQEHLATDELSFIFRLKVSDNATLYGVCLHVQEIVQRAPGILGAVSPLTRTSYKRSRFLVSAPRCYCILTRVPFFELHYEMLNSLIAQERLDRITQFVNEITLMDSVPHCITEHDQLDENYDSPQKFSCSEWMGHAIPVDSVSGLLSSPGLSSERDIPAFLFRNWEPHSPESVSTSEASDFSHVKELEKENRKGWQHYDDCTSENSGSRSDSFERVNGMLENGQASPDVGTMYCSRLERVESLESLQSSVRGDGSDYDDDELSSKHETNVGDEKVMEWAKAHNNEPLQIVCGYHALPLPPRGGELVFHPLEHLQPIKYCRPGVSLLDLDNIFLDYDQSSPAEVSKVLALFAGALLEKQVVVMCPNLGVLSAIVLSIIPMIRPFEWQSLLLPVLPRKMVDFLDAPVPFIVGIQHKPTDVKMKTANLIRINVNKDQVKACSLPQLPLYKELVSDLRPFHARLSCENSVAKRHPIYRCSEVQVLDYFAVFMKIISLFILVNYHQIRV
ncbi:DENN domain-containing protein 5B [Ananas comosus]|uniref:DENN domain-containing protein 5B n=1 Tax=Ananas comosus TaxID=4615 RepID=A0A199UF16_ANACO|nr:DENN domain-containing protein 5B [Ananas comosus]